MKVKWGTLLGALFLMLPSAQAYTHDHHVKHNMVLVGESEVFASHLVYKSPHNYQVILKLNLNDAVKEKYLTARRDRPEDLLILLLDATDISKITTQQRLSGVLYSQDPQGKRIELDSQVTLDQNQFKLLYFDEVPLSLAPSN